MALYHTHRPQTFDEIIGQQALIQTLKNQVARNNTAHAYLFSGPRGVGKTTAARVLAKAVNCSARKSGACEPCNTCESCMAITRSRALDVIEIDAASYTGVDNVRENIIDNARFKPTVSPFKVFIIDEIHMLSNSAFNALLKTLEEPPKHVMFILATTEIHKIPDTIISRCQRFTFSHVPYDTIQAYLKRIGSAEGVTVDETVLHRIIQKTDGCVRDAISLLEQTMATGEKHITEESVSFLLPPSSTEDVRLFVDALFSSDTKTCLLLLKRLYDTGANMVEFADDLMAFFRLVMIATINKQVLDQLYLDKETTKHMEQTAKKITGNDSVRLLDMLLTRRNQIKTSPLPHLPLELFIIEWAHALPISTQKKEQDPKDSTPRGDTIEELPKIQTTETKKPLVKRMKELVKKPNLDLTKVRGAWQACIEHIEKNSPSLVFILKMTEITGIDGATIELSVPYLFHKEKLTDIKCKKQLMAYFEETLGSPVDFRVVVTESDLPPPPATELQELAAAFGGEVVS